MKCWEKLSSLFVTVKKRVPLTLNCACAYTVSSHMPAHWNASGVRFVRSFSHHKASLMSVELLLPDKSGSNEILAKLCLFMEGREKQIKSI